MAGRGRGRGQSSLNLNTEGLGLVRGQVEQNSSDPPPVYPPLGSRPQLLLKLPEHDYMLAVMKDFVNNMKDSQFAIVAKTTPGEANKVVSVGRYSDRLQGHVQKPLDHLDWKRFPMELAPTVKAKRKAKTNKVSIAKRRKKVLNPDEILDGIKEGADEKEDDEKSVGSSTGDKDDDEESNKANEEMEEEELDEELDDGTDYANNYFDNGENYLDDEDDNMDEGGIY